MLFVLIAHKDTGWMKRLVVKATDGDDFSIFIPLSRESDGGAMHRTSPDLFRSCFCFRVLQLNFASD